MFSCVVVVFNIPGVDELYVPSRVLSLIFMGVIRRWNHPMLNAANPSVTLPDQEIVLLARKDGSGNTEVFTASLSRLDPVIFYNVFIVSWNGDPNQLNASE